MKVEDFLAILQADFYTGVPDSLLRPLNDYLMDRFGENPQHHIIAANEGNAAALAAGYYLATGKVPVVYLQNSGEGNVINPLASLLRPEVCGIPVIFVIGWRGEPGVHDEPQHIFQGKVTASLLETMEVTYLIVDKQMTIDEFRCQWESLQESIYQGKPVGIIVRKGALESEVKLTYQNDALLHREEILAEILQIANDDVLVATTGKTSRELFELREKRGEGHGHDFLTVGAMGHSSSIALGIALQRPDKRVWCIDGDGAALMHLGAWSIIGKVKPENLIHVVINNGAHESIGGLATAAKQLDLASVAHCLGYEWSKTVIDRQELVDVLQVLRNRKGLALLEVKSAIGSRKDLGRPTLTAQQVKQAFREYMCKE